MKNIRIATRKSKLALIQANQVLNQLSALSPETKFTIVEISTKGDRDKSDFLYKSDSVGFFTSEVEKALLDDEADIAVHSFKDLPTASEKGLIISAIPQREQVNDVIVAGGMISSINALPKKIVVGTSSLRRITQLKKVRLDLEFRPLRGNVETRINKVWSGEIDAVVLAQAGVTRLGLSDQISLVLSPEEFIPAPAQGALAVQTRQDDSETNLLVAGLDNPRARITAETERQVLAELNGGCSIPLGAYSQIRNETIHLYVYLSNLEATHQIRKKLSGPVQNAKKIAQEIAQNVLNEGGREILEDIQRQKKCH